jgi:hypothetical protein
MLRVDNERFKIEKPLSAVINHGPKGTDKNYLHNKLLFAKQ